MPPLELNTSRGSQEKRSLWQEAHKEAMRVLKGEGVNYGSRKLASYSQAIAYFLLLEQAVESSSSQSATSCGCRR